MTLELHPLCTLFPRLAGEEFAALKADIEANGLRQPIVVHDGMILDGGNRYRACVELGLEPALQQFSGGNLVSFVLSANLHRRHLTPGQQAAIVASAQDWAKAQAHGGARRGDQGATLHLETAAGRAAESGASVRTQKMADKVAKADPALARKVAHGEISLPKAVEQVTGKPVKAPPRELPTIVDDAPDAREQADVMAELADEVQRLTDRLAVEAMDASEEEKTLAADTIAELRAENESLRVQLRAAQGVRDQLMQENAELKRQCMSQQRRLKKLEAAQ